MLTWFLAAGCGYGLATLVGRLRRQPDPDPSPDGYWRRRCERAEADRDDAQDRIIAVTIELARARKDVATYSVAAGKMGGKLAAVMALPLAARPGAGYQASLN